MDKVRQIIAVLFLVVFTIVVFNYSFFRAYIKHKKSDFRKEIVNSFSNTLEIVEMNKADLYLNKNGIEWVDENKEVVIYGKFYEVIAISVSGCKAMIKVIKDDQETKLFSSFFTNHSENSAVLFNILKLLHGLNISDIPVYNLYANNEEEQPKIIDKARFHPLDYYEEIIKPPTFI